MSKILYVTDLDGTLLNSNQKISNFTSGIINDLVKQGMIFSYATARSNATASKVTQNLTVSIPVIVYNGVFIIDSLTGENLLSNYFTPDDFNEIFSLLNEHSIYPIIYSNVDGNEKFTYLSKKINRGMKTFLDSRKGDIRDNPVDDINDAYKKQSFYFSCIDEPEKLFPVYKVLNKNYSCVYHREVYSGEQWLEIMPAQVNKANAILQLKKLLGCEKIISFGDGNNDIPMFQISDECYAVQNAVSELKSIATGIIDCNDKDGIAKWLQENVRMF